MKFTLGVLLAAASALYGQTVYLRTSAPAGAVVTNATWNGATYQITTQTAHGFSAGNTVIVWGVCTNSAPLNASTINGIRKVASVIDANDFTIQTTGGANIANSGTFQPCGSGNNASTGLLTAYTLGSQPFGFLDGTTGPLFRQLALSTSNSNVASGLANTGSCPGDGICVSGGVITITTTYPHGVQVTSAGRKPEYFAIWGTASNALNTNGTYISSSYPGVKGSSYAVTGATTYTFSAAAPAGVGNGDYTQNDACGSNGTTPDSINGDANCVVVTQLGYQTRRQVATASYVSGISATGAAGQTCVLDIQNFSGGQDASGTVALTGTNTIASGTAITITASGYGFTGNPTSAHTASGTASCGGNAVVTGTINTSGDNPYWDDLVSYGNAGSIAYRHLFDGGQNGGSTGFYNSYNNLALQFLVDQENQPLLTAIIYSIDYLERGLGVSFDVNESTPYTDGFISANWFMAWDFVAGWPFLSSSERTTVLNKVYNDIGDPTDFTQCSTTNVSIGNKQLAISGGSTGTFGSGTSGSGFQLGTGFPTFSIVNNVIAATVSGNTSYGAVATYNTSTGTGTVASWSNGSPAAGGTYTIYQSAVLSSVSSTSQLTSGTATAGSTSSVTLNTASSPGNYVNDEIFFPTLNERAFISAYNTSTGVATLTPALTAAPGSGTFYSISQTVQVTGYNTSFTSSFNIGDAILMYSGAIGNNGGIEQGTTYIVNISSNTVMYGLNGQQVNQVASTTTPQVVTPFRAWQPGDCGWLWAAHHSFQDQSGNPFTWPPSAGDTAAWSGNGTAGFMAVPRMSSDFFLAQYDARAVLELASSEAYWWDFNFSTVLNYEAGIGHWGPDYTQNAVQGATKFAVQILANSLTGASPAAPNFDLTGNWSQTPALGKMFLVLPDYNSTSTSVSCPTPAMYGSAPPLYCPTSVGATGWGTDGTFLFAPASQTAQFYRNFLENMTSQTSWSWGQVDGSAVSTTTLLSNLPTIGSVDFTTQPLQYLFGATDYAAAQSLTGWNYGPKWGGFTTISRTTWSKYNSSAALKSGALLMVQFRAYAGDYDCNMFGHVSLYQAGDLLGSDIGNPNNCGFGDNSNYTVMGDELQFGGSRSNVLDLPPGPGTTIPPATSLMAVTAWSSANHGSWPAAYGDQHSQYMRVCGDESGGYNHSVVAFNYDLHCVDELKPTGGDHFVIDSRFVSTTTSQQIATHIHYPQNGQTASQAQGPYAEGHTTCPGSHGCTGLDSDRWIQELESGTSDGYAADPTPSFGLISKFLSPSNIYVSWDCPGGVECNSGSTYAGGAGDTDRITICAGTGSCNSSANLLETFTVHKIAGSLTDTNLTASAISTADGNWFGAQMYGANSCAVAMEARGGVTHATMSSFTPPSTSGVCSNNVQYLFGGLTPGSYNVTAGGNTVSGSPFTVTAGDNSIEFTSVGGAVSLTAGGGNSSSSISGQINIGGNVVVH
jgi:hypothetical protein